MADEARAKWNQAFTSAQAAMPAITKDREADLGKFTYKYADLHSIIEAVRSVLAEQGLGFAQDTTSNESGLVGVSTRIYHEAGHVESFGPLLLPGGSDARSAGASITYARRYALCAALGIAADEDTDGHGATSDKASDDWGQSVTDHSCPKCSWLVRKVSSSKPNAPKWACTNPDCKGGNQGRPWASWKEDEFEAGGSHAEPETRTASPAPAPSQPAPVAGEEPGSAGSGSPGGSDADEKEYLLDLMDQAVTTEIQLTSRKTGGKRKASVSGLVITARELASKDPDRYGSVPVPTDEGSAGQWWVLRSCSLLLLRALADYVELEKTVNADKQQPLAAS